MPEAVITLEDVKKYFPIKGGKILKALDGVSFSIYKGETLSLVGESGCGKTSCARTILGIHKPTAGRILYYGKDTAYFTRAEKKPFCARNTMIFQDPYSCLDPRMTIGSIIAEGVEVHRNLSHTVLDREIRGALSKVGLAPDYISRFPHELSGGQRQRAGIARALALNPEFIICDEPIAALDVSIQAQIINLLIELQEKENLTYLFISHDLSMVRHISDRIAVMYLGQLMELAETNELFEMPQHPYTQALFSSIPSAPNSAGASTERIKLKGEIPSPIDAPPGCKFSSRCPRAEESCKREMPLLRETSAGHFCACGKAQPFTR